MEVPMRRSPSTASRFTFRPARRVTAVLASGALAAAALAAVAPPASAAGPPEGPAGDAFYTPPSPLPPGRPGDVIWQRRQSDSATATTYLVLYRSTTATGAPTAVSGTVAVPKGRNLATTPIVSSAPGTLGLGDTCAASKHPWVGGILTPTEFLERGFAVATTDYEGLGTPGTHTYVVGRSEGHAVIDAARAAQRLGIGLPATAPVGFFGYSQGGGGAGWAGQLAGSYAPELQVKGTAVGGIPADLTAVGEVLDGNLWFGFLAAAAAGLDAAYPELDLERYLTATGRQVFAQNQNACVAELVLNFAFHRIADYTTSNPLEQADWQARLRENLLGDVAPSAPVYQWHARSDEILPYDQAAALWRTWCAKGGRVTFESTNGGHFEGLAGSGRSAAVQFLSDRFAGKPAAGNCPS
jgi:hypothetical protein